MAEINGYGFGRVVIDGIASRNASTWSSSYPRLPRG